MISEHLYLSDYYNDEEDFNEDTNDRWSASKSHLWGSCPAKGYYGHSLALVAKEESPPLYAGKAIHAGLAVYYASKDTELALATAVESFGERDQLPPGHKYSHLNVGHLEVVLKNYFDWANRRDTFQTVTATLDDLNLEKVLGARFKIFDKTGEIILGESKVVFMVDVGGEEFKFTVIPDLPIFSGGGFYVLDHKSTNGYLSDWYFAQHRFSNQLRLYCWAVQELTATDVNGALINGIYMGDRASLSDFKGTRFTRYGPLLYAPAHLTEAIYNHYYWSKIKEYHEGIGYYPQNAGRVCQGCDFADLCAQPPALREAQIKQLYYAER